MRERPEAEALLMTDLDRCLLTGVDDDTWLLLTGDRSRLFSEDEVHVSRLL